MRVSQLGEGQIVSELARRKLSNSYNPLGAKRTERSATR